MLAMMSAPVMPRTDLVQITRAREEHACSFEGVPILQPTNASVVVTGTDERAPQRCFIGAVAIEGTLSGMASSRRSGSTGMM